MLCLIVCTVGQSVSSRITRAGPISTRVACTCLATCVDGCDRDPFSHCTILIPDAGLKDAISDSKHARYTYLSGEHPSQVAVQSAMPSSERVELCNNLPLQACLVGACYTSYKRGQRGVQTRTQNTQPQKVLIVLVSNHQCCIAGVRLNTCFCALPHIASRCWMQI